MKQVMCNRSEILYKRRKNTPLRIHKAKIGRQSPKTKFGASKSVWSCKQRKIPSWNFSHSQRKHHSKIYTDGSKKDAKVGNAVVLSESTIKRREFPQNSIYSAEQSAIINAIYSTANYNQKRVIITDSLSTIMAVSDRKSPRTQKLNWSENWSIKHPQILHYYGFPVT
jgi:hypothetical protein